MKDKNKTNKQLIQEFQKLRNSEELYRMITDNVADVIWKMDMNGKVTFVTPAVEKIIGYTVKEFTSMALDNILVKKSQDLANSVLLKAIQDLDFTPKSFEQQIICKDGTRKWTEVTTTLLPDASGKPAAVIGVTRDITKRKKAEDALKESESKYRILFEDSTNPITLLDREGTILMINPAGAKNLGMSKEDCIGKSIFSILKDLDDSYHDLYHQVIDNGIEISKEDCVELPTGNRWFWSVLEPVSDAHGKRYRVLAISYEITEKKKTQIELEKAQRLESLGILAGGIAHDFNNLLGGLFGYIDIAKEHAKTDQVLSGYLDKAMSAFVRAKQLTQQLLTFAKGGTPVKKAVSIASILSECTHLALSGSNVSCKQKMSKNLKSVHGDAGQLTQVFNNILLNSRQAMPTGGTITINATNKTIKINQSPNLAEGQYIQILIQDQGTGIPENLLAKVFDPFFTTKQAGSGLGLATSYSIIKRHEGHIAIDSRLGEDTTVKILLPASSDRLLQESDDNQPAAVGAAKILLMDDEQLMLDVATEMLTRMGHEVVQAKDGKETVYLYKKAIQSGKKFDLVILDLTVPGGMGGQRVIKKLFKINPEVRAIVSSGYSDNPVITDPKKYGFMGMIAKPYRMKELCQVINNILRHT